MQKCPGCGESHEKLPLHTISCTGKDGKCITCGVAMHADHVLIEHFDPAVMLAEKISANYRDNLRSEAANLYVKVKHAGMESLVGSVCVTHMAPEILTRMIKICREILESNENVKCSKLEKYKLAFEGYPTNGRRSLEGLTKVERHTCCAYMIGILTQAPGRNHNSYDENLRSCVTKSDYDCLYAMLIGAFETLVL